MNHIHYGQLSLGLEPSVPADTSLDISFMHRSLCVAGLPVRASPDQAEFKRTGNGFTLKLVTPSFEIPDSHISVPIGVPYGPKARLLILWMATRAKELSLSSDRFIEIGAIKDWLKQIGIQPGGRAINLTKEQLIKICQTLFMVSLRADYNGEDTVFFRNELFVEQGAIATDDIIHYKEGRLDKIRWPDGIKLTEAAWKRFNSDVVPVPTQRLEMVAHSATAIDIFLYLAYRLPKIEPGSKETMTWKQLSQQFSSRERMQPSKFKEYLGAAVRDALKAYPEARIEETPEGYILHHSDPAELRKPFFALSGDRSLKPKLTRRRHVTKEEAMT